MPAASRRAFPIAAPRQTQGRASLRPPAESSSQPVPPQIVQFTVSTAPFIGTLVLRQSFLDHDAPPPRPFQIPFQVLEARLPAGCGFSLITSVCRAGVGHVLLDGDEAPALALGKGQLEADARERLAHARLV